MFKIYVFGNPLLKEDSLPIRLLPKLRESFKDVKFIELDPTETIPSEEHFIILDTIINSNEIRILKDIDKIEFSPNYSLHDFDLGFNLKLMKKLGKIKDVTIVGVPPIMELGLALEELKKVISSLLSENG